MGSFKYLLQFRPYLPWVFSSLAIGYVTYLQWNLRRLKAESKKQPMNKTDLERRHEVNIDTIDRTEDNGLTCCSDGTHSDDCCCSGEGINESVSQLPRCRRTAFSFFVNDSSKKSQLTDTEHSQNDKFVFINFAKECAHKWKELSSEEKAFYHKLSKEDGYRYERELQEYKQLAESQTKRSESTCKLEVNVHFEQPRPPVNQTKTVIHATTLLADSIPSKETHESSDQLIGEARLASHVPTTECVLLSIESPNDSLSNGPANLMGSSKRKVSLETASESDSTRIDHTDESIEKRSNEIEVFESILPETDVQNESIEPCDESIKAVTGVARIETYDEFPASILASRVAQSGNSKKNENGFSNFLNEKETAETYFLDDLHETVNTIETTAETDLAVGIEEPKVPFVKPFRQSIDHSSEELGELDDLAKENNMKPFNGNTPNLEDEAFDLFANEQMPLVREIFAPLHRRMSGEEMLDELLNRWTKLPAHLKDGYFYKAMQSQDEQTA